MDLLFLFFLAVMLAGLCYTIYRLYQLRAAAVLAAAAVQFAVCGFLAFSYRGGAYREPFVVLAAALAGLAPPAFFIFKDLKTLRKKLKERFGLSVSNFLYQNDRNEQLKVIEKEKYVDQILRPRTDSFSVGEIMGEIRVERADTSKNIQKQLEIAAKKYDESDYEGAYASYQIIEKVFNRSPSLYFNIGNIEYDRGEFDAAARSFRRGAECAGLKEFEHDDMAEKYGAIQYNLGNVYFNQKKYARAIEAYKNSAEAWPPNTDALYNLSFCHAMDFEDTGDTEKAVDAFGKLAENMPDNLHAWFHYGKCLLKMKKTAQAIECFQKVVSDDIMFYEAWYRLAIAYDAGGKVTEAVKAYYTSIQIKPDFIDAYNNLGVLLSTAGRHGEALKVLKSGLRIKPGDTELIYNIGMTQYELEKYEEALHEFLTCIKLKPDDETILYMISLLYMNMGKAQDSMAYLERAIKKDPAVGARASKERVFQKYVNRGEYSKLFAQ